MSPSGHSRHFDRCRPLLVYPCQQTSADHSLDADGNGTVTAQRLYQLARDPGSVADHTFEIRFLDPGVQAYAFTFG